MYSKLFTLKRFIYINNDDGELLRYLISIVLDGLLYRINNVKESIFIKITKISYLQPWKVFEVPDIHESCSLSLSLSYNILDGIMTLNLLFFLLIFLVVLVFVG